jgi:TetR/AcrR family transcriptional repressor of mexCD-oprJ operon
MTPGPPTSGARAPRADARRNIEAILDAAAECLTRDSEVSIAEIATAAGVGRITLYGHFKSRAELIEAVLMRTIDHADAALADVDLTGDPVEALVRITHSSWEIVDRFRGVMHAARRELPVARIRTAHDRIMGHLEALVEHGRSEGVFRTDLPTSWLVTTAVSVMHAAAEDVESGHLKRSAVAGYVAATLVAAYTPPGTAVPAVS